VYPTYLTLSAFKGWKRYYLEEARLNKPADAFNLSVLKKKVGWNFGWWRYWLRRRKGLRRAWIEKGYMMVSDAPNRLILNLNVCLGACVCVVDVSVVRN
jgi:hypothetical protein